MIVENPQDELNSPNGCHWCGLLHEDHGWQVMVGVGAHLWEAPSDAQRKARILARRKNKNLSKKGTDA